MTAEELRERRNPGAPKPVKIERGDYVKVQGDPVRRWRVMQITDKGAVLWSESLTRVAKLEDLRFSPIGDR